MRKPTMKDIFFASKIARKINLKGANIDMKGSAEEVGGQLILHIFENMDKAEDEISQLLGGILEIPATELMEIPLDELFEKIQQMEGLSDFFSSLGKSPMLKSMISSSADTEISNLSKASM